MFNAISQSIAQSDRRAMQVLRCRKAVACTYTFPDKRDVYYRNYVCPSKCVVPDSYPSPVCLQLMKV